MLDKRKFVKLFLFKNYSLYDIMLPQVLSLSYASIHNKAFLKFASWKLNRIVQI